MINMIVCQNNFGYIGKDGKMLYHIPRDLAFFKKKTKGNVIIMGRKTYESLPNKLPDREHWVITKDKNYSGGDRIFTSVNEVLDAIDHDKEYFVIGGGQIYKQFMDYADIIYITQVDDFSLGDVIFPSLNLNLWHLFGEVEVRDDMSPYKLTFRKYVHKDVIHEQLL